MVSFRRKEGTSRSTLQRTLPISRQLQQRRQKTILSNLVYFGPYEYAVADGLKIVPLNDGKIHDIHHVDPDFVSINAPAGKEATHGS